MLSSLYGGSGVPVAALERLWQATAEDARSLPAEKRGEALGGGVNAALGLLAAGDVRPLQEFQAMSNKPLPPEMTALLALSRRDTIAARKALAEPDSNRPMYAAWAPLQAQAQYLLGDYDGALETLKFFETPQFSTRGFDPRWAMVGRARLLRAAAYEKLGRRTEAAGEYQQVLAQWKTADPDLQVYIRQAQAGLARVQGPG
jgi:tetratricopeptide (TPR) repeat protein